jgi:formaldehyde-activating enzyme involved in methanogenesis
MNAADSDILQGLALLLRGILNEAVGEAVRATLAGLGIAPALAEQNPAVVAAAVTVYVPRQDERHPHAQQDVRHLAGHREVACVRAAEETVKAKGWPGIADVQ